MIHTIAFIVLWFIVEHVEEIREKRKIINDDLYIMRSAKNKMKQAFRDIDHENKTNKET